MLRKSALFVALALVCGLANAGKLPTTHELLSPDGKIKITVSTVKGISYKVECDSVLCLDESRIRMTLADGTMYGGEENQLKRVWRGPVDHIDSTKFYKTAAVRVRCNLMSLEYKTFNVEFCAFDDAVSYRFISKSNKAFKVADELAQFNFAKPWPATIGYVCQNTKSLQTQLFNSYENVYERHNLDKWNMERLAFSPLVVEADGGLRLAITEANVLDYPGMFLYNESHGSCLKGVFAGYPKELKKGGHRDLQDKVLSRENFIAQYDKAATDACAQRLAFPWRIVAVSRGDAGLLANDVVYRLATPSEGDFSWVKPGKVAWDWWNDCNLRGVDFKTGVNNETYKFYIDFASKYGIEYIIMDEGWATDYKNDLYDIVPSIDLPMLCSYAASKNVGIILWAGYRAFNQDMDAICKHFSQMGVKGWKIDFMDRDDQPMVQFTVKAAQIAAKYHMIIDFHGIHKPAGLTKTMPNVLNYEAVYGLENMRSSRPEKEARDQVVYDVTFPYLRLLAGPADYTQGAMINSTKKSFRYVHPGTMSQGTRCRQFAEYVIFDAPLTMLCDSPSNYMDNDESTRLIVSVPVVWDEIRPIDGKIGEYIVEARRKGADWWIAGITDWTERDWVINASALGAGKWKVELFADGVNADKAASDYKRQEFTLDASGTFKVHLAPGGGFLAKLSQIAE